MARKKTKEVESTIEAQNPIENPRLTPEQYWEWRTTIAELELAKKALEIATLQLTSAAKDIEIMTGKAQLFKSEVIPAKKHEVSDAEAEYLNTKKRIEGLLGISLNDKIIDAATLEVKDAPQSGS